MEECLNRKTEESEPGKEYSLFSSLLPFHIPLSKENQPEGMETSLCIPQTWHFWDTQQDGLWGRCLVEQVEGSGTALK